ncbi:MFS transporter [Phytoactinopolyspora mesophila]|uniref:MFS transporter n=1 Tax=Phytoactinopolyspora mesophila TaxID=2650750 RepID=A0A7K3M400_9ACTN|nr:MFS transporter [Phytoactinopolyspora mesophila]NDL58039.1 MFS transporter [Phytoactinopolyspora mesophila]
MAGQRSAPPASSPHDSHVPAAYWLWLSGAACSMLGTQVMAFAMAWSATGQGGLFAGLVLTMVVLPRILFSLVGGAIADRVGAWPVLTGAAAVMLALMLCVAGVASQAGDAPALLLVAALAIGLVDAFHFPASASVPRLLVADGGLARAASARQIVFQLSGFVGAPLGGLLVATAGLAAAALANAAAYSVMLAMLIALSRRGLAQHHQPDIQADPWWRRSADGLKLAAQDALLRPALLLIIGAAAFLLPLSSLLVPLLARERQWPPASAGVVVGAIAFGTVAVAGIVTVSGARTRPGYTAATGLLVAAAGVTALALAPTFAVALPAGAVAGVGTGLFTTHVVPLILGNTPRTHTARIQAVVLLAQSLPLLVTNNGLGALVDLAQASTVIAMCATGLVICTLAVLAASPTLRRT